MSRTRRGDEGQSTVELALVLPLVALVVLVVLQVGLVLRDHVLVGLAAREAARAAAVSDDDRAGAAERAARAAGPLDPAALTVSTAPSEGETVRVEVSYRSATEVPLVGRLLPDVVLSAETTMAVEAGPLPG